MIFSHDTSSALLLAAGLVNTAPGTAGPGDRLPGTVALDELLDDRGLLPHEPARPADLTAVRALRPRIQAAWQESRQDADLAALANELLAAAGARPWLTDHSGEWHFHVTRPDASLAHRIGAQIGFALADLVRLSETERLRRCLAPDCQAVLVDLSRNHSRLYCDTGNCGNRQHVAAYRARWGSRAG